MFYNMFNFNSLSYLITFLFIMESCAMAQTIYLQDDWWNVFCSMWAIKVNRYLIFCPVALRSGSEYWAPRYNWNIVESGAKHHKPAWNKREYWNTRVNSFQMINMSTYNQRGIIIVSGFTNLAILLCKTLFFTSYSNNWSRMR